MHEHFTFVSSGGGRKEAQQHGRDLLERTACIGAVTPSSLLLYSQAHRFLSFPLRDAGITYNLHACWAQLGCLSNSHSVVFHQACTELMQLFCSQI
jgi:hypothetical protein